VFAVDIDRTRAQGLGLTARDVTNSLVVSLAGSSQVSPTYWLNPANGVQYPIVMQTPQYNLDSLAALANLPVARVVALVVGIDPQEGIGAERRDVEDVLARAGLEVRWWSAGADLAAALGDDTTTGVSA